MVVKIAKTAPRPSAKFTLTLDAAPVVGDDSELPRVDEGVAAAVAFVPFSASASSRKAVKLCVEFCTGFTAKTMPAPQCELPSAACCSHCGTVC